MTYSTAEPTNEYGEASVDDILAEYQYEQHSAMVQASYEAIMQSEPESNEEDAVDEEGVKVYRPKNAALNDDNPFKLEIQESPEIYGLQNSGIYYDEPESAPAEDSDASFADSLYEDARSETEQPDYESDYGEYTEPDSYASEYSPDQYEEGNEAYCSEQDDAAYYGSQDVQAYEDEPDAYVEDYDASYYEDGADTEYYNDEAAAPQQYSEEPLYEGEYPVSEPAEEYAPGEDAASFLTAEDFEAPEDEAEIDPRFNLGGERKNVMLYDGRELDLSPEENYIPPSSSYSMPVQEDRDIYEEPVEEQKPRKKFHFGFGRKKKAPLNAPPENDFYEIPPVEKGPEYAEASSDETDSGQEAYAAPESPEQAEGYAQQISDNDFGSDSFARYADKTDYAEEEGYEPEDEDFDTAPAYAQEEPYKSRRVNLADKHRDAEEFPSFGRFVLDYLGTILFSLKNTAEPDGSTMNDSDENLGREVNPMKASKYYGSHVHSLRLRLRISLVIILIMAYISLGFPVTGMMKTLPVQAAVLMGCQLCIMLLSLDVLTGAVMNIFRGRFGADSLAVFLCVLTSFDALSVTVGAFGDAHTPFCLLSSLSMAGVLLSSLLSARGLRKALRVPAIGKTVYTVTGETGVKGDGMTLLKSVRSCGGFVRRTEEAPPDETLFSKLSPILLIVCILLALAVAAIKKSWSNYLFILTALLAPAVPLSALLCFSLPFFVGSMRIFSSGASIAGWSGLCDIGASKNLVVTDRDLFPQGSVEIENILILDDMPSSTVISYAGAMLGASDCGLASCFIKLMEKNNCEMKNVQNFEYMAGGGFKGIIDGDTVLCGSLELMRLMDVHVPYRQVKKTPVLLAVNGMLYGIFNMKYTAQPQVRKALVSLIKSNRHPIFAVRDFNITPEMLREHFDLATDGYDFPPFVERFAISKAKPGESSKISAVVCREGLGPLTHMADTGRSMYLATRINILLTVLSAVIGIMAVFLKFLSIGAAGAGFMLVYMLIWLLPVAAMSLCLKF